MPPRPRQEQATDELSLRELLAEFRDINSKLENVSPHVEIIASELEQIRQEINWVLNNREDLLPLILKSMSSDPCARPFRINQADQEKIPEVLACAHCDTDSPDSLADALAKGWTRLQEDLDGAGHSYLGCCPSCVSEQEQEDKPPIQAPAAPTARPKVKKGPRTSLFPQDE